MAKRYSRQDVLETAERLKNWGRWGPDDQAGALNFVAPEDIVGAARLVRRGQVFPLGLPLDRNGPQAGLWGGRWNPIHTMLATGTDALAGKHDEVPGLRYADDALHMPAQCATHCDALSHIFLVDRMWNGYDASLVDCRGAPKCGIEHVIGKMVGRGVLLDVARHKGVEFLEDGTPITVDELEGTASSERVEVRRGDFLIVRTGQMEDRLAKGEWGRYAGGEAPGLAFETCEWLYDKEVAMICSDTWGIEVRPNEVDGLSQPLHWVTIPAMGVTHGEMFFLKDLAVDCAADRTFEFFFTAAPLNVTHGTGSPLTPLAIK